MLFVKGTGTENKAGIETVQKEFHLVEEVLSALTTDSEGAPTSTVVVASAGATVSKVGELLADIYILS